MEWIDLRSEADLESVFLCPEPVLIFKHSQRCIISRMAKAALEKEYDLNRNVCKTFLVEVVSHRDVSNEIEKRTGKKHESPQCLVLKGGKVIYAASHSSISANQIHFAISA